MTRQVTFGHEVWPLNQPFTIARGSRDNAAVVRITIGQDGVTGQGEGAPSPRYGETPDSVEAQLDAIAPALADGADRAALTTLLRPGAARAAADAALWDLEAKLTGRPVWALAGLPAPVPVVTAFTIGLDSLDRMAEAAHRAAHRPLLKIKLNGDRDLERIHAVRAAAPDSRLIVDANEAWTPEQFDMAIDAAVAMGVAMIEQPFPADADTALNGMRCPIPLCADESCHDRASLDAVIGKYDLINIKLDKTGGLTEALALREAALRAGLGVMVGCMLGTGLSMAPAILVAQGAEFVDLDGPLWLRSDRSPALEYSQDGRVHPAPVGLWG